MIIKRNTQAKNKTHRQRKTKTNRTQGKQHTHRARRDTEMKKTKKQT